MKTKKTNLETLSKVFEKEFPEISKSKIKKYLTSPQDEYLRLSPLEFSELDERHLSIIIKNIQKIKYGELMGS